MAEPQILRAKIAGFPALRTEGAADRPPVLFIHGAFAGDDPFINWMRILALDGWRTFAAVRRNHLDIGPDAIARITMADYVADTLRVVDALGVPPVIVGHSLGGLIAQKIAELGKCRAAVLASPAPSGILTPQVVALPALLPMLPKILLGRPLLPSYGTVKSLILNRVPVSDRARIYEGLRTDSGRVYRQMMLGRFRVDSWKVRCPIMVVGGNDDRVVSKYLTQETAALYAADLQLYDGHAHWLLEEPGWQKIGADIAAWLRRTLRVAV